MRRPDTRTPDRGNLRRSNTADTFAIGGDCSFLLERLRGWVVKVTRTDGTALDVVIDDAGGIEDDDGVLRLSGFLYPEDENTDPGDAELDDWRRHGDGYPDWAEPVRIPWERIDLVEPY